jgi:hypothetical protein
VIHSIRQEAIDESRLFLADGRSTCAAYAALPTDTRNKPRVDDRRAISSIGHVLKSGGRWIDAPDVCGPRKALYNCVDSSAVKAHRCACHCSAALG